MLVPHSILSIRHRRKRKLKAVIVEVSLLFIVVPFEHQKCCGFCLPFMLLRSSRSVLLNRKEFSIPVFFFFCLAVVSNPFCFISGTTKNVIGPAFGWERNHVFFIKSRLKELDIIEWRKKNHKSELLCLWNFGIRMSTGAGWTNKIFQNIS